MNRVLSVLLIASVGAGVCRGQDYIRNVFGMGKKAAPKSEAPLLRGSLRGNVPPEFLLTPANGPFHIFIASYVGELGADLAVKLAIELRQKHGLNAYVHNYKEKDYFGRPNAEQLAEMRKRYLGAWRPPQYKTPPTDNWVVVVGDFAGMENDRAFDATMKKLRRLKRDSFTPEVASELRWGNENNKKDPNELVSIRGTANPLRPKDEKLSQAELKTIKLIKEMNDPEPYSIYHLRKPYTMCVYSISATIGVAKDEKKSFFGGEKKSTGMAAAADSARVFCKLMREMGEDAYIFHSDTASVVCVNGYDGPTDPKFFEDFKKYANMNVRGVKLMPGGMPKPLDPTSVLSGN
jgi:hypothetical protein